MSNIRKLWYLRKLMKQQWLKTSELEEVQRMMLKKIIKHAYENVPFYHRKFDSVRITPDDIKTVSEPDGHLIKRTYNVASEKITYINNGTHVEQFYRKVHEKKRIIFIGRLVKWKGIKFFPKILDSIPEDIEFLVVGGGPLEGDIINLSKKYKNIKYFGDVPHSKIPELLSISDVLILPTFTEASPNAVIEASAAGIPSVAFSVGDVPNLLPGENGFAIKPYDINEFCNSLNLLLNDDALREEMGRNARVFAERNLDYSVVAGRIMKVLESVYRKVLSKSFAM